MDGEQEATAAALRLRGERLATLARLARPVQHEINNLLTVIFANLEMLKRSAAEGAPQRQLDRIAEAARRFDASTRALLTLSRRPVPGEVAAPLTEAVEALRPLLLVLLPGPGALVLKVEPEGWPARFDRALLDEALVRLAVEVADTVPRGSGLAVSVANRPAAGGAAGQDRVELTVLLPGAGPEAEPPPAALGALLALARAGGGQATETVAEAGRSLTLSLPRHVEAEAAAPA